MGLMDFIKKQFIDVIQWTETDDGDARVALPDAGHRDPVRRVSSPCASPRWPSSSTRARWPTCSAPACYKLTTQTLPVLTNLMNWDKLFESPFKSDVYFFSTRLQINQRWGTPQPITIRDKEFGAVRLRAFGIYSYRIVDPTNVPLT